MKIAVQMDPIEGLDFSSDSTIALIIAAQERGYAVWIFTPQQAVFDQGRARAHARKVAAPLVRGDKRHELSPSELMDLSQMDVVLVRQEPPYDVGYHVNTFVLASARRDGAKPFFVNDPRAIRNVHEKMAALALYDLMPATVISANADDILAFADTQDDTVVKPLSLFSGQGIFRRSEAADFRRQVEELIVESGEPVMAQQFLPGVTTTDKRVMVVDGKVIAALGRRPKEGGFIANIHAGGKAVAADLTERERAASERVAAFLREEKIFFAGVDLIDGYLSEINVTCPTLIWELVDLGGPNIAQVIWDGVEQKLSAT